MQLLECGARGAPQSSTVVALAEVLGVSLDWLVRGLGEEPTPDAIRAAVDAARARASSSPTEAA